MVKKAATFKKNIINCKITLGRNKDLHKKGFESVGNVRLPVLLLKSCACLGDEHCAGGSTLGGGSLGGGGG